MIPYSGSPNITLRDDGYISLKYGQLSSQEVSIVDTLHSQGRYYFEASASRTGSTSGRVNFQIREFIDGQLTDNYVQTKGNDKYGDIVSYKDGQQIDSYPTGTPRSGFDIILGFFLDLDNKTLEIKINNDSKGVIDISHIQDPCFVWAKERWAENEMRVNFGKAPFVYDFAGYLPYDVESAQWFLHTFNLIKSNNKIYTISDKGEWFNTGLLEPLTKDDFITHGIELLPVIPEERWSELGANFEILTWTDRDKIPKLELTIPPTKPYRLLDNPSIVTYTEDEEVPILSQTVLAESKVRFLVSKNKTDYQVYRGNEWFIADKSNIIERGMTKAELESIPQEVWAEWFENEAHKHSFDILIGMYSESPSPLIRGITVNYAENESPIIINAYIEPDTIHNEFATLKAHVKDYEGDRISFKVLIKKAGTNEFVQVSPLEGWYNRSTSETEITQAFNFPYFNPGENEVRLVVKDERGVEAEWIGKVILSNTDPTITLAYDDFSMRATIGDDDNDMVAYRIAINGELIFDYTDFMPSKAFVDYVFDTSKLKFGEENIITIEAKDTHGGYAKEEFTVIGSYRGLMFKNENGEYFVDDKGEILMDLLFGKILIGGQTSETKKVILENRHEFPITNVQITPENPNFVDGAVLEISETEMPFTPKDIIKVLEVMPSLGEKDFYVRVKTTREAHQGGYFYINSKATPVLE